MMIVRTVRDFKCDGCNTQNAVIGYDLKLPDGWEYAAHAANKNCHFCPKCIGPREVNATVRFVDGRSIVTFMGEYGWIVPNAIYSIKIREIK